MLPPLFAGGSSPYTVPRALGLTIEIETELDLHWADYRDFCWALAGLPNDIGFCN